MLPSFMCKKDNLLAVGGSLLNVTECVRSFQRESTSKASILICKIIRIA